VPVEYSLFAFVLGLFDELTFFDSMFRVIYFNQTVVLCVSNPPLESVTKKGNATLDQHIEILDWFHANDKNQSKTAKHFNKIYPHLGIKQSLVSLWVKDKAKW
jgi:hypothetical protein